jgi:hypothetical protein
MALDGIFSLDIIEEMENYVERNRPEPEIRHKLDLGYRIENQSVFIHSIRPHWDKPEVIQFYDAAKCTYVQKSNEWKVFWLRASGKWESYPPTPKVKTIGEFVRLVEEDRHFCFFG